MALQRQTPSAGGFAGTAGQAITKPITTTIDSRGNSQKRVGGSYKKGSFRSAGPTGRRSR